MQKDYLLRGSLFVRLPDIWSQGQRDVTLLYSVGHLCWNV